jgi:hypothetical protein
MWALCVALHLCSLTYLITLQVFQASLPLFCIHFYSCVIVLSCLLMNCIAFAISSLAFLKKKINRTVHNSKTYRSINFITVNKISIYFHKETQTKCQYQKNVSNFFLKQPNINLCYSTRPFSSFHPLQSGYLKPIHAKLDDECLHNTLHVYKHFILNYIRISIGSNYSK